jgi:hypothetical protein
MGAFLRFFKIRSRNYLIPQVKFFSAFWSRVFLTILPIFIVLLMAGSPVYGQSSVAISAPSASTTSNSDVTYTLTYTGATTIGDNATIAAAIDLDFTGDAAGTVGVSGSGSTRTVTISGITGNGTLGITLAGGTSSDASAIDDIGAGPSTTFIVDNTLPRVSTITRKTPTDATTNVSAVTFEVLFSESVTGVSAADFELATTLTASGTIGTVTGSGDTWSVPVGSVTGDGNINLDLKSGFSVDDLAGNTMTNAATTGADETYTIDNTGPTSPTVTVSDGNYKNGDNIDIVAVFNEPVNVATATPRIAVTIANGGPTVYADLSDGDGTNTLTFTYIVGSDDLDSDGVTLTSPIDLNGATMKDGVGNDATLTYTLPNTTNVKVDGIAPTFVKAETITTTSIEVTFSEDLQSSVNAGSFSATDLDVASASRSGDVVTLTLNTPVGTGYSPSDLAISLGAVKDVFGNNVAASIGNNIDDKLKPEFVSALLTDPNTVVVTFSELLDDTYNMPEAEFKGDIAVSTATVNPGNKAEVILNLSSTELNGVAINLDLDANAVRDIAGNNSADDNTNPIDDGIAPSFVKAETITVSTIEVTFDEDVQGSIDETLFSASGLTISSASNSGSVVTLNLGVNIGTGYSANDLALSLGAVKDVEGNNVPASAGNNIDDKIKPEFVSALLTDPNTVVVTFSELLDDTYNMPEAEFKGDISTSLATVNPGNKTEVILNLSSTETNGLAINLDLDANAVRDLAGNNSADDNTNPITDGIAPSFVKAETITVSTIELTFDEDVQGSIDETLFSASGLTIASATESGNVVTLNLGTDIDPGYSASDLALSLGAVKDITGNNIAASAGNNIDDKIKPEFVSALLTDPNTVVVTFSELLDDTYNMPEAEFKDDIVVSTATVNPGNKAEVILDLSSTELNGVAINLDLDPNAVRDIAGNNSADDNTNPIDDGIIPTLQSVVVTETNDDGIPRDKVVATFDEDMNLADGDATGFSVTGTTAGPITGISVVGDEVTITLTSSVIAGEPLRLVYNDPDNLEDQSGNKHPTFDVLATNDVRPRIIDAYVNNTNKRDLVVTFDDAVTTAGDGPFGAQGQTPPLNTDDVNPKNTLTTVLTFTLNRDVTVDDDVILEYDNDGSTVNALGKEIFLPGGTFLADNNTSVIPEPSNHVTDFNVTAINNSDINVSWTDAIGPQLPGKYMIVGIDNLTGTFPAVADFTSYPNDLDWSDGLWIYNDTLGVITSPLSVTGLISGRQYTFRMYSYTNQLTNTDYKLDGTIPEQGITLGVATNTTIQNGIGEAILSSIIDSKAEAIAANPSFSFDIVDDGAAPGSDTAPTYIKEIVINRGGADETGTWLDALGGVVFTLSGGPSINSFDNPGNINISADKITISGIDFANSGDLGHIADNGTNTYELKVWLQTNIVGNGLEIDNKHLVFNIAETDLTVETLSFPKSSLVATSSATSGDANNNVEVTATKLYFKDISGISTPKTNFNVTVQATDINNNRDYNRTGLVQLDDTSQPLGGNLISSPPPADTDENLVQGQFIRNNLQVTKDGDYEFEAVLAGLITGTTGPHTFSPGNTSSDITISSFISPSDIAYINYQEAPIDGDGVGDIKVAEFTLRDGGLLLPAFDPDGAATSLTSITFSLSNFENINHVALHDGNSIVESKPAAASLTFNNLTTIEASDDGTKNFGLYVSFKSNVVDNANFRFQITNATADGSTFGFADAANGTGGAITSITGTQNHISVSSTELRFIDNASDVLLNVVMTPLTIEATDILGNRDLDRDTEIVSLVSTGTLSGTPLNITLTDGFATFPDVIHTDKGLGLLMTAALTGHLDAISVPFDVTVSNETTITLQDPGVFTSPSNILYKDFQATDITGVGIDDIKIAEFVIKEGGADLVDGDGVSTYLTGIEFGITNHENLRKVAIYDQGGTEIAELSAAATIDFTGFSYEIPETETRTLQVYVSYNATVDDNEQSIFSINNVTNSSQSSDISSFAASTDGTGDINRIEVVASKLEFTTEPAAVASYASNLTITPILLATDVNNNTDIDYTGPVTITNATGLTMVNEANADLNYNNGVITFNSNFRYTGGGTDADGSDGTLTVSDGVITDAVSTPVTVNYSGTSDIIEVASFSHTDNIDYTSFQENVNIIDDGNSIVMERFKLRDGGGTAPDDDGNPTILNEITLQIANWENLRRIELFDAGANNALATTGVNEQIVTGEFVTFSGLTLTAPDNGSIDFTVRVSFHGDDYPAPTTDASRDLSPIGDNEAITFTVTSTLEDAFSSQLEFVNAGGATSTLSGDENRIEVTADRAIFTSDVNIGSDPSTFSTITTPDYWVIKAKDEYYSTDVDFTNDVGNITTTGFTPTANLTFQLNGSPVVDLPGSFTAGVYDFQVEAPTLQYTLDGLNGFVHVAVPGITDATSNQHSVFASEESVLEYVAASTQVLIPYKDHVEIEDPTRYSLGEFIIRDGGVDGTDVDGGVTSLSDLTIDLTNSANLADIALYDDIGTLIPGTVQTDPTGTVSWTGLAIIAPDNGTKTFSVRAFFKSSVTDNHNLDITVTAVAENGGSKFEFDQGGVVDGTGAATPAGDNLINVVATQLDFDAVLLDPEQGIYIPITPAQPRVYANDEVGNLDLDFSETVVITTPGAGIGSLPASFSNLSPGILDFPDFEYTSTGDGTITVTANGLTQTSNTVDVIHTTFSTLDNGSGATNLNNGIEALSVIIAGGKNKAVLGFSASSITTTTGEPTLQDLIVRFNNPITNSLENIRLVTSPTPSYSFVNATVKKIGIKNLDNVEFNAINTTLPLDGSDIYYFVIADIIETADFTTASISPELIATGTPDPFVPNEDVILSTGSIEANIVGRSYVFNDANPPVVVALTPANGGENFPQTNLISIQFNEAMVPKDSLIYVKKLIDGSDVAILKILPGSTSADSTTFFFNPAATEPGSVFPALEGDTDYYITINPGVKNVSGFLDKSGNPFAGFTTPNDWAFKTSDNVAPFFTEDLAMPSLPAEAVNILDVGFDLRISLDEAGKLFYIVVDPDVTTGTPTVAEIRGGSFPGTIVSGEADILRGFEYHYVSIFDDNNFPTPDGGNGENFRVWVTAEDLALPAPNAMVDGDPLHPGKRSIDGTFVPNPGGGVIIQNTPLNEAIDVCIGSHQIIFAPINIVEGASGDFNVGNDQTMNFVLPPNFEYKTDMVTVTGQGPDISVDNFNFINNTILTIQYDITGTSGRDKLVIGGMEIKALGNAGTTGDIIRLGGTGATAAIPDGTILVSLNTIQAAPVEFITDPNTSAIGDANEVVALLTPSLTPLDKGTKAFSGPGVFGDTLFIAASGLGTHTITLDYTSELGCVSEFSLNRTIFDSDEAIAGLDQVYATDFENDTILYDERLPSFLLIGLGVEVAPDQLPGNFNTLQDTLDVASSLDTLTNGNFVFKPEVFKSQVNFDKFFGNVKAGANDGGLIGTVLFTGVYENQFDTNLRDTLKQTVEIWLSPTGEITIGSYGPIGNDTYDSDNKLPTAKTVNPLDPFYDASLEFCEYETNIELEGSSPNGFFSISIPRLEIENRTDISALTDNQDGSGSLNIQELVDDSTIDFLFGEIDISFTVLQSASGDSNTVTQTIRINPTPVAEFIVPEVLCELTPIKFFDATAPLPSDILKAADSVQIKLNPATGINDTLRSNAVIHPMTSWAWEFGDPSSGGDNPNIIAGDQDTVYHTYNSGPNLYTIKLTAEDDFGCAATLTDSIITVGGIPEVDFVLTGTSLSEEFTFQSTSTVFRNNQLNHSIDRVAWDLNGDSNYEIDDNDNDPENDNDSTYTFDAAGFLNSGEFDINFIAVSTEGCSESLTRKIHVLDNKLASDNEAYSETFSNASEDWVAYPEVTLNEATAEWQLAPFNSWAVGNPTTSNITEYPGTSDIAAGSSWVTNLSGTYGDGERSYVYSPTFDLSTLARPMIQFDIARDLEAQDGVVLEYSTDNRNILDPAKEWIALGDAIDEGIEWFNATGLASKPGDDAGNPTALGWDGTGDWVKAKHDLAKIYDDFPDSTARANIMSRVNFRMALGAIAGDKDADGFAFDNVRIGNRTRTVLLENFTSMAGTGVYKTQNDAINDLAKNQLNETELVVVTYHTSFDGTDALNQLNPSDPGARALYYGISENPRVAIDGVTNPPGENLTGDELLYENWGKEYYRKQSLQIAPFDIDITLGEENGKLKITADMTATTNEITDDFVVHVAIIADTIEVADFGEPIDVSTGETMFYSPLVQLLPNAAGTKFELDGSGLSTGDERQVELFWNPFELLDPTGDITESNLRVVVFIQDEVGRTVHQADYMEISGLDLVLAVEDQLGIGEVTLYPNPASNRLNIQLSSPLLEEQTAIIFDNTGKRMEELRFNAGQDKLELNTSAYTPGIYLLTMPTNQGSVIKRFIISHN